MEHGDLRKNRSAGRPSGGLAAARLGTMAKATILRACVSRGTRLRRQVQAYIGGGGGCGSEAYPENRDSLADAGTAEKRSAAPLRGPWWIGKPGSVVGRHSSGMDVAIHLERPTRRLGRVNPRRLRGAPAYLVLLPGGFAVPVLLPVRRWALTPPFHPCLIHLRGHRRSILCCTFRRVAPPWYYQAQHPVEPGLSSALADSDALIHPFTVSPKSA